MAKRLFLTAIAALLFAIGMLPILAMLMDSAMVDGRFSLAAYRGLLASPRQWTLMGHSLALASLTTACAVTLGMPLGILFSRTDLPLRRVLAGIFVIPLLIPPYIIAVSWSDLLGPSPVLFSLAGCTWVLSSVFLPIPMLLTMAFLKTLDPHLEEAGRLVTGWWGVIRGITLPLILPGVMLSALLVFLLSFGEFGVPNFLRYGVFSVESFTQFSAFYDFKAATAAALPLAGVTAIMLLLEGRFLREKTYRIRPAAGEPLVIELGPWRWRVWGLVALLATAIVIVPIAVLALRSAGAYAEALDRAWDSLLRSLAYAAAGASLLAAVGFFTGYLIQTHALRCWRWVDSMTVFLLALPSTVIGIGLIGLWNTPWTALVYGTPAIILLGYVAKYTALTSRISVAQLALIPPSMEEAAQIAGAGWFRRMALIVIPLARRGLLAGWLVGYIFSLRDTGITMLVYPPGHETLPVRIFTLMANGSPELIAALCMVMIAAALLPAGLLWLLVHR